MDNGDAGTRDFSLCVLPLHSPQTPLVYVNQPKERVDSEGHHVVITTNIRVNKMARRLEERARKYARGGNRTGRGRSGGSRYKGLRFVAKCSVK
jgi:hypothetical protein